MAFFLVPICTAMKDIHNDAFRMAAAKATKYQKKYKEQYDEQHKVRKFSFKMNSKVQYRKHYSKRAKGAKSKIKFLPNNSYLVIHRIDRTKKMLFLKILKRIMFIKNIIILMI